MKVTNLDKHAGFSNIVLGDRGVGKTYYFVRMAYEAHKKGHIVISNVWLNFPHIRFTNTKNLVPILEEIAEYNWNVVTPSTAPASYLKAYGITPKKEKSQEFFLLIDELGIHFNHRNWAKNFKQDFLLDMIFEPRKYGLTIVGICQEYDTVDVEFLRMCHHWFTVKKQKLFFEWTHRVVIQGYYVRGGDIRKADFVEPFYKESFWHYFERKYDMSNFSGGLYYTREMQGVGAKYIQYIPNMFQKGDIYSSVSPINLVPESSASSAKPFTVVAIAKNTGGEGGTLPSATAKRPRGRPRKK